MSQDFKSANSAKIGKVFFDARENFNLSLEEISSSSLINIKYLKAIECGDYSDFPSEGFARAYFIKYAKFLNINIDFPAIYATENRKNKIIKKSYRLSSQPYYKIIIASSIAVFLSVATLFIFNINKKTNQASYDSGISVSVISEGNALKIIEDVQKNMTIYEMTKKNNEKEVNFSIDRILLSFKDECWVEIYSNEKLIEYQLFQSGDDFSMIIKKPFKIVVGDAEAVTGSYNGNSIDFITNANRLRVNTIIFDDE
jgi:cytoskeletal protein RodZ